jgi:hypothetical protein
MNSTLIRTVGGKSLLIQHDVSSPRPYSRIQFLSGTKGAICDYPFRVALEEKPGAGAHKWFSDEKAAEICERYRHPLWKSVGAIAKKIGGHGGMDFIMDLRWAYCLQNALPLDMDVYDLASWSSIVECSRRSDLAGGAPVEIPDFTRGAWKTAKPNVIGDVDLSKMGLDSALADSAGEQLDV